MKHVHKRKKQSPSLLKNLQQQLFLLQEKVQESPLEFKNFAQTVHKQEDFLFKILLLLPALWLLAKLLYAFFKVDISSPSFPFVIFSFLSAYLLFSVQTKTLKALLCVIFLSQLSSEWASFSAKHTGSLIFSTLLQGLLMFSTFSFIFLKAHPQWKRKSTALSRLLKLFTFLLLLIGTPLHIFYVFTDSVQSIYALLRFSAFFLLPLLSLSLSGEFEKENWFQGFKERIFPLSSLLFLLTASIDFLSNIFRLESINFASVLHLFYTQCISFLSLYVFIYLAEKTLSSFELQKFKLKISVLEDAPLVQEKEEITKTYVENIQKESTAPENFAPEQTQVFSESKGPFVSPAFAENEVALTSAHNTVENEYYQQLAPEEVENYLAQAAQVMQQKQPSFTTTDNWLHPYEESEDFYDASLSSPTAPLDTEKIRQARFSEKNATENEQKSYVTPQIMPLHYQVEEKEKIHFSPRRIENPAPFAPQNTQEEPKNRPNIKRI